MLDLVHCKVLSVIEHEHVDAYLLSESSMFIFPHKLVLKTCGITTLLAGLPRMLELAALAAGFPHTPANPQKAISAAAATHRVFYSRKNYLYPDQQQGPHRSWRDEVRTLDRLFRSGSAYMIGKMNGEHWYLYLTDPDTHSTPPGTPDHERTHSAAAQTRMVEMPTRMAAMAAAGLPDDEAYHDETLEVLMTDLDPASAKQFYLEHAGAVAEGRFYQDLHRARRKMSRALGSIDEERSERPRFGSRHQSFNDYDVFEQTSSDNNDSDVEAVLPAELSTEGHALGSIVSEACGLSKVYSADKYPDARIDAYLFTPCGFSANGVVPAPTSTADKPGTTHYFTVHVTPEPQCSYASFETNVPAFQSGRDTIDVVEQVVDIFKPGRFSVTIFEAKLSRGCEISGNDVACGSGGVEKRRRSLNVKGYRRVDRIVHDLNGYELEFRYFEKHDWRGGPPRLGEVH